MTATVAALEHCVQPKISVCCNVTTVPCYPHPAACLLLSSQAQEPQRSWQLKLVGGYLYQLCRGCLRACICIVSIHTRIMHTLQHGSANCQCPCFCCMKQTLLLHETNKHQQNCQCASNYSSALQLPSFAIGPMKAQCAEQSLSDIDLTTHPEKHKSNP